METKTNMQRHAMQFTEIDGLNKITALWYQKKLHPFLILLLPFSLLMVLICIIRRFLYQSGILKQHSFSIPIIVVGNLTVGGTGKTPLVIYLAKLLKQHGFNPGVVSRGYKIGPSTSASTTANAHQNLKYPIFVKANSDPSDVGDEPVLMAKRLFSPIVVDPNRVRAVRTLLQDKLQNNLHIDVIISDDGLQHYAMGRFVEIVVVDGKRGYGNGFCLPAGPLREPMSRLKSVDFIIVNSPTQYDNEEEYDMELRPRVVYKGKNISEQKTLTSFLGQRIHAVAGIGHPDRFFDMLTNYGLLVIPHPFPDHYRFEPQDIQFDDDYPVLMTEKDAVKCSKFMGENHWVLSVDAIVNPLFDAQLLKMLQEVKEPKNARES